MSPQGIEVQCHIEKWLPKILRRSGKENPSKRGCKVAFVQRKCAVTSSVSVLYTRYVQLDYDPPYRARAREWVLSGTHVGVSTAVWYLRLFGNLPGSERMIHEKTFQEDRG